MKRAIAIVLGVMLTGCASNSSLYDWGKYQSALLTHTKNNDQQAFRADLIESIERAEKKNKVPPGLYAELGYNYLQTGEPAIAITYFEKEKAAFPESTFLMDKMIDSAKRAEGEVSDAA